MSESTCRPGTTTKTTVAPSPAQWLVDMTTWRNQVDPESPPETCQTMAPAEARHYASLILEAAQLCELFQAGQE
jgi:hypothetical protein